MNLLLLEKEKEVWLFYNKNGQLQTDHLIGVAHF